MKFPCPRSRLRTWSREISSAVPSCVSLLILHTQAESGALPTGFLPLSEAAFIYLLYHSQPPSGQSRVYQVTQLRTGFVHCRESAGSGPVVLRVVPVAGAALGIIMVFKVCALLLTRPAEMCCCV